MSDEMIRNETVVMVMPSDINELQRAATHFAEQYASIALIEVRGHLSGSQQEVLSFSSWQLVARIDNDLGLLGVGIVGADDEELLWLKPMADVEVRLSLMEEENEQGYLWNKSL